MHRAESIVRDPKDLAKEMEHIKNALRLHLYPDWILEDIPARQDEVTEVEDPVVEEKDKTRTEITEKVKKRKKIPVVIPYVKGLSEPIRRVFKSYEVPLYFNQRIP